MKKRGGRNRYSHIINCMSDKLKQRLSKFTDDQLKGNLETLAREIKINRVYLYSERCRRGISVTKAASANLKTCAIAGMLAGNPEMTLSEIGEVLGVSREYVRQERERISGILNSPSED